MKVSYRWLNDYIELGGIEPGELAERITRGGIEVDGVEARNKGVSQVVAGYVLEKEKHPDADKLNVCKVEVGGGEPLQIVCGARNVDAGQKVPVALVGAKLPGGLDIKRAKLRGVESQGMICSAKELGLNDKLLPKEQQEGILVLPEGVEPGTPIADVLGIDDYVLELDLTPNRADCLSMLGVAYEVGALTGAPVKLPEATIADAPEKASDRIAVHVAAPDRCPRYAVRYIAGVKVGPSPQWMQNRLMAAGVRPINNIVDITNYVMLEYGQPLHAFDADKLAGGRIGVRLAETGEKLETLDGQVRELEPHMLLITDAEKPVGLAGVMGGANSEVSDATVNIVLESANFDGGTIRRTSRQLGLRSEASLRFEKGVDDARVLPALDRAASLMARYADGKVAEGIVQVESAAAEEATVRLPLDKVNRYLGTELSRLEVKTIFGRLGFDNEMDGEGVFTVKVPTRRGDITRDVDLIEEVARLYGYDNIPTTPIEGETTPGSLTVPQAIRRELRRRLTDAGITEVIGYSFVHPDRARLLTGLAGSGTKPVKLSLPMSEDRSVLRTGLVPGLMGIAAYNRNRKNHDVSIFEIGSVFLTDEDELTRLPRENHRLAALLTGSRSEAQWNRQAEAYDFYDAKGILELVFEVLGVAGKITFAAAPVDGLHPGRSAEVLLNAEHGTVRIGYVGQLHPALQLEQDLEDTYVLELELGPLNEHAVFAIASRPLPRFPAIVRDIAVVIAREVEAGRLIASIREAAGPLLESVRVFDVYTGERLGDGRKSVALSLVYRHAERTLTDEEVAELQEKAVAELEKSFGAELRK